jgi:dipeptidyl aminopeptidase/acylaminoacyl peptidase
MKKRFFLCAGIFCCTILSAQDIYRPNPASIDADVEFVKNLKSDFTVDDVLKVEKITQKTSDIGFSFLLKNANVIDSLFKKKGREKERLSKMIVAEKMQYISKEKNTSVNYTELLKEAIEEYPLLSGYFAKVYQSEFKIFLRKELAANIKANSVSIDWDDIKLRIANKVIGYNTEPDFLEAQINYFIKKKNWNACEVPVAAILKKYGNIIADILLNEISYSYVVLHCSNKNIIADALKYMRLFIEREEHMEALDTYASLLYKWGEYKEALIWSEKALVLAKQFGPEAEAQYQALYNGIKIGEKIWEDSTPVPKQIVNHSTWQSWPLITGSKISSNGNYVSYMLNEDKKSAELVLKSVDLKLEKTFPGIFSSNTTQFANLSRYLVALKMDSMYIINLSDGQEKIVTGVVNFKLSEENDEQWLVYKKKTPSQDLIIKNLNTQKEQTLHEIEDYQFKKNTDELFVQTKSSVSLFSLKDGKIKVLANGTRAANFVVDDSGKKIAFIIKQNNGQPFQQLRYYQEGNDSSSILTDDLQLMVQDKVLSNGELVFSGNADKLFFKIQHKSALSNIKRSSSSAILWNYKETTDELKKFKNPIQAVIHLNDKNKLIVVSNPDDLLMGPCISPGNCDFILVQHQVGNITEYKWKPEVNPDFYLVSTKDGSRKLIKKQLVNQNMSFSALGKYTIWVDRKTMQWYTYNIATGITKNITKNINSVFYKTDDHPDYPGYFRMLGWLTDDSAVLIYDSNDLWQIDPDGIKPAINLTRGYGRKNNVFFDYVNGIKDRTGYPVVPVFNKNEKIVLSAFDNKTKQNGFFSVNIGDSSTFKKLSMGNHAYSYDYGVIAGKSEDVKMKAYSAERYLILRMSSTEYPNLFTTEIFSDFKQITDYAPQKKYNWYTSELHHWKLPNGKMADGILYKPEDFNPSKKYPVIFYYYEENASALNLFLHPELSAGNINIPWFVSNGYLVFVPDMYYENGHPGETSYLSVSSAAKYLSAKPWVNSKKMGLQGHSFGGFETNYILTRTSMFAAACPAAGPSNLTSAYLHSWNWSGTYFYERRQQRIGATLWERPDLYIENSSVFKADKVTTPVFIMHDTRDEAVHYTQGAEWYNALRRNGKKVWMVNYPNEYHIIDGLENRLDFSIRLGQFFDYYLKDKLPPKWMTGNLDLLSNNPDNDLELDNSGTIP